MLWVGLVVDGAAKAMKQVTARATIFLLALAIWTVGALDEVPFITFSHTMGNQTSVSRWCTADELLPRQPPDRSLISPEWSTELIKPPYGCDCSFYKTRYFCPDLGDQGYRAWVPQAAADGVCKSVTRSDLRQAPLPPNFKVLVYGNSYLRQVVEGLMCMFSDKVKTKRVRYRVRNRDDQERTMLGDAVCRDCWGDRPTLRDRGCISEDDERDGCLCNDDYGEFVFENGAALHYVFANTEASKSLSDALPHHGNVSWSWYDAVFANEGNPPTLSPESVLATLAELQEVSVPFFWLNTYEGGGDVSKWENSQRSRFQDCGAKHVKIDAMTLGMKTLTKGAVEDSPDPHFCLPGPPDEMALLLVKMMWALHFEAREK